jgi:hypothetical protein
MKKKIDPIAYAILSFIFSIGSFSLMLYNILSERANAATRGGLALAFWGPIEASAYLIVGGIGGVFFGILAFRSLRTYSFSTKFTKLFVLIVAFIGTLAGLAGLSVFFYLFIAIMNYLAAS